MRESVSGRYGGVGLVIAGSRVASPEAAVSDALVSRGTLVLILYYVNITGKPWDICCGFYLFYIFKYI